MKNAKKIFISEKIQNTESAQLCWPASVLGATFAKTSNSESSNAVL